MSSDQTTIFFRLKLKRTRTPLEVFEKMQKAVKKKGATKDWTCFIDDEAQYMTVNFGDEKGDTFYLSFDDKKVCDGFCKVFFPLSGELFDDEKKSEFKALINMIYAARTSFSEMKITDDYGISESFLDTKVNKIALRELTEEEMNRAERLLADGHTDIKEFITALVYDYRDLPYSEDFIPYINCRVSVNRVVFWEQRSEISSFYAAFIESFLLETTEYKDMGRLYSVNGYFGEMNGIWFSVKAFLDGIKTITKSHIYEKGRDPKSTQVLRLYYNKCQPLIEAEGLDSGKCILAYRFFVSAMEYLGFRYVGRNGRYNSLISESLVNGVKTMLDTGDYRALEEAVCEFLVQNS